MARLAEDDPDPDETTVRQGYEEDTLNAEYNVRWKSLPTGKFRHRDHRFEWTRNESLGWASAVLPALVMSCGFWRSAPTVR